MKFQSLWKVGAGEWANYYLGRKNVFKSDGKTYVSGDNNVNLDISDPKYCIVSYTHGHDILFGKCNDCALFAIDFMVTVNKENLQLEYISQVPSQEIADLFTRKGIKDDTKSRNKIFKMLVNEYVDHIEYKHPELIISK
jgi:hypothetical protein